MEKRKQTPQDWEKEEMHEYKKKVESKMGGDVDKSNIYINIRHKRRIKGENVCGMRSWGI